MSEPSNGGERLPRHGLWILIILGCTAAAYLPALAAGFCYDDEFVILRNPTIQRWTTLSQVFTQPYWQTAVNEYLWRPFTSLTFGLNWLLTGGASWAFHAVNIGIHLLNVFLLFRLLRRRLPDGFWVPWICLLWAVHPLLTEDVVYTAGRADLMAACFVFLGLLARNPWLRGGLFLLGLLSKENALILPLLVLIGMGLEGGSPEERRRTWGRRAMDLLPLGLALILFVMAKLWLIGGLYNPDAIQVQANPFIAATLSQKIPGYFALIGFYAGKILFPLKLSIMYYGPAYALPTGWFCADVLGGLACAAGLAWLFLRRKETRLWLAWTAAAFLPFSQIIQPIGAAVAERFMYLPPAFLVAAFLPLCPRKRWVLGGLLGIALLFSGRTFWRSLDYRDNLHLYRAAVRSTPNSTMAHYNLAQILLDRGHMDEAVAHFEKVRELDPSDFHISRLLANLQARRGLKEEARAILEDAFRSQRFDSETFADYLTLNPDLPKIIASLESARDRDPSNAGILVLLGRYLLKSNRPREAVPPLEQVWNQGRKDPSTALLLADAHLRDGNDAGALPYLDQALSDGPAEETTSGALFLVLTTGEFRAPVLLEHLAAAHPDQDTFPCALADLYRTQSRNAEALRWVRTCLSRAVEPPERRAYFEILKKQLETGGR
jgi:tetratricopeptide (TPR) repeat protein